MPPNRTDPNRARVILETLLPEEDTRIACMRFLADSIQLAHRWRPSSWGITLQHDLVRLNVGRIEAITVLDQMLHVVLHRDIQPKGLLNILRGAPKGKSRTLYRSVKGSFACDIKLKQIKTVLPLISESHRYLVRKAGDTPRNSGTAKAHSPGVLRHLEEVLAIKLPDPDYSDKPVPRLSALRFEGQFQRFKKAVLTASQMPFRSFKEGLPLEWEGYKEHVHQKGQQLLDFKNWKRRDVGTGRILAKVIRAIEINDGPILRNNLVHWMPKHGPQSVTHRVLKEALGERERQRHLEGALFDLFHQDKDPDSFALLQSLGVSRYDVLAYLCFLKDLNRYMPIATSTFDRAFQDLGIDLKTASQASWENYGLYNDALTQIRDALRDVAGLQEARLIDAHSFCWLLVRLKAPPTAFEMTIPLPKPLDTFGASHHVHTALLEAEEASEMTEADFDQQAQERRRLGRLAEDIALRAEQGRLRLAGRADLAASVKNVANKPSLGFDIQSYETNGEPRQIEVKAARNSANQLSFFLSNNEWCKSRQLQNYYFYVVFGANGSTPDVRTLLADQITDESRTPLTYLIRLASKPA